MPGWNFIPMEEGRVATEDSLSLDAKLTGCTKTYVITVCSIIRSRKILLMSSFLHSKVKKRRPARGRSLTRSHSYLKWPGRHHSSSVPIYVYHAAMR